MGIGVKPSPVTRSRYDVLDAYVRAANYLGAAQLYLRHNVRLDRPLEAGDIKPRLLGHWGTQPGINLIYAHLNRLIIDTDAQMLLVVGPGHGAPAVYANLYLEGTLALDDPALAHGNAGMHELTRRFSWPGGNPSHITPATRGSLHEGGELGYSLAHAFGAAFDNPELIVPCIVGDGEAETGPLAAGWNGNRFLDPRGSGAVLPILHLNGARLSGPTLLGRMSKAEVIAYVEGHGYEALYVDVTEVSSAHVALTIACDHAYEKIRKIQNVARSGPRSPCPRWPAIVLRSPKGMTGPQTMDGKDIAGTYRAHGIPIPDPATNLEHLAIVEAWLRGYAHHELFDADGIPREIVTANVPRPERQLGRSPIADPSGAYRPLVLPDIDRQAIEVRAPGAHDASAASAFGAYLREVFRLNAHQRNFRLFSPDETMSNKLEAVFEATERATQWPVATDNADGFSADGRILETLSEHNCEGWLEGYILSGRHGVFVSYEAFAPIVDSMLEQYAKWLKVGREVPWRTPPASLNLMLTSHVWRQEHNGFSHQGPGLINQLLSKKRAFVRAYFPPDANTTLVCAERMLASTGLINVMVAPKQPTPQWLDLVTARMQVARGASIWDWASNDGAHPDIIFACAGDVPTLETLAAVKLLREAAPSLRVRVVNVIDLLVLGNDQHTPLALGDTAFEELFNRETPVVFAYHGYPDVIHELVYRRPNPERFHVRGYIEEGMTTTPFDIVSLNRMSRFHLALDAAQYVPNHAGLHDLVPWLRAEIDEARAYAHQNEIDPPAITTWRW